MPKLTDVVLSQSRSKFRNYKPVPLYKQILPASLKNTVSTKGEGRKGKLAAILYIFKYWIITLAISYC